MRAVAILPVVLYHSALAFPGGYVGVDVFFVISGYLITKIIYDLVLDRQFSFIGFYDRRIRRLFPALFVMLLAVTVWAFTHLIWTDIRNFGVSMIAATLYVSNIFFYENSGYFVAAARTTPLVHTWSLAVEEQFYIVVPFVVFALARYSPRRWHVPLLAALSLVSFILCLWLTKKDTNAAFYLLPPRAWELGIGGMLAIWAPDVGHRRCLAEAVSAIGMAAILYAIIAFGEGTPFPGWHVAIPTLGTAAVLSTGGRSGAAIERLLSTTPFTFVGKISYSLYLWHWPVIVAFTYAAARPITSGQSLLAVAISFVLAILSWRFVERPLRRRDLLPTARSLFIAAAAASAATVAVGAVLHWGSLYQKRYPAQLTALLDPAKLLTSRRDCYSATPARVAADRLCVRGAPGVPASFVFVGDSHAGAISDGLFTAARSRGLAGVQFTASGVVPLPGERSLTNDVQDKQALTDGFVGYLRHHPQLRTVIVAGFWTYRATGRSYRHQTVINVDDGYDGSGAAYNPIAFRHGLERLVRLFPDRRFIFLDDTPSGDALNLDDYVRQVYNGIQARPVLPRAVADAERATYEPILERLAREHANVTYAPVFGAACGPKACPLFRNGQPMFIDGDHLSHFGSMQFAPALAAIFDRVSGRAPVFEGPAGK